MIDIQIKKLNNIFFAIILSTISSVYALYSPSCVFTDNLFDGDLNHLNFESPAQRYRVTQEKHPKKPWTILIYMSADNDLRGFSVRNIKQMAAIGSNQNVNIIIHLDIRLAGGKKITRRYYIEKNKIIHMNAQDPHTQSMDSGNPNTLYSFCHWGIQTYPADRYALFIWNHGSGILEPVRKKIIHPSELFFLNPAAKKLELDRSINFINFISDDCPHRGICWDNSSGNYITNNQLDATLTKLCKEDVKGKFDLIGYDTCFMAMIEIAHFTRKHTSIMVASQEVELGIGWNYQDVLAPFVNRNLSPEQFAHHIVTIYQKTFGPITNDYTLSALHLDKVAELEANIHQISTLLYVCLTKQKHNKVRFAIKKSRNPLYCTHFEERSYICLGDWYARLKQVIPDFMFKNRKEEATLKLALNNAIDHGLKLINQIVFANIVGRNLKNARGISIYFPETRIHNSYYDAKFVAKNAWAKFLNLYLAA